MPTTAPNYKEIGRKYAQEEGAPWEIVDPLIRQESGWQHYEPSGKIKTSHAGALGIAQLMPGTAAGLGVDPRDPLQNLRGGIRYLVQQLKRYSGNVVKAVAAYNAGPGNVDTWDGTRMGLQILRNRGAKWPNETEKYLDAVLGPNWQISGGGSGNGWIELPEWIDSPENIGRGIFEGVRSGIVEMIRADVDTKINSWSPVILTVVGIACIGAGIQLAVASSPSGRAALTVASGGASQLAYRAVGR